MAGITHGDGTAPRTGVNLIRLRNGDLVQAMVIYLHADCYEATELEYELGRPRVEAASPLEALQELRCLLDEEICQDGRALAVSPERERDAAFARICAGARP